MIRSNVVTGVMSFDEMDAMMYKIEGEDLYLIGTSEHSMICLLYTSGAKLSGLKLDEATGYELEYMASGYFFTV